MKKFIIILSVLFLIFIGYLLSCIVVINDLQVGIKYRRTYVNEKTYVDSVYNETLKPGIHFVFLDKVFKVNVNQCRDSRDTLHGMTKEGVKWSTDYITKYAYDEKKLVDLFKLYGEKMDENVKTNIKLLYKLSLYAEIRKDSITLQSLDNGYEKLMIKISDNVTETLSSSGIIIVGNDFFKPVLPDNITEMLKKQKQMAENVKSAEENCKLKMIELQKAEQELKQIKKRYK